MLTRIVFLFMATAVWLPVCGQGFADKTYDEGYGTAAVSANKEAFGQETVKTRYFLSTNVVNLSMFFGNIALEVRFPNNFAFKGSVVGGYSRYPFSNWNTRMSVIGFHPEARWYVNRSRSLYLGMSGNLLRITDYDRRYDPNTQTYFGDWYKTDNSTIVSFGGLIGYYLRIGYRFGMDFNLGLGLNYESDPDAGGRLRLIAFPFFQGITQIGVSLSWEVGKNPPPRKNRKD